MVPVKEGERRIMASRYIWICDRCRKEIPLRPSKFIQFRRKSKFKLRHTHSNMFVEIGLCENCKRSFENWLKIKSSAEGENND